MSCSLVAVQCQNFQSVFIWAALWMMAPGQHFTDILKELEHRKLGWKVLILKYYLGKTLSKGMWCKMADIKKNWLHILKDEKCM